MDIAFLPDTPIEETADEHLGYTEFINLLRRSIDKTATPFVFGVLGDWGSGKTSTLKVLKRLLEIDLEQGLKTKGAAAKKTLSVPIWFSAWKYENEANLLYPLLNAIKQDYKQRLEVQHISGAFADRFKEVALTSTFTLADIGLRAVTKAFIGDAVTLESIKAHLAEIKEHPSAVEEVLSLWTDEVGKLEKGFEDLLKAYAGALDSLADGETEVRFVILVDDLDRCLPETVIGLLEKIKNFLSVERCIFVLALNPSVVYQGIKVKYHGMAIDGREYLEKIMNYSFYIPEPKVVDLEKYCSVCYSTLFKHRKPGETYSEYLDRLRQTLVELHFTNPRKIKRLLNHYLFFIKLHEEKGDLDQYHLPDIIRIIILAENHPDVFKMIISGDDWIPGVIYDPSGQKEFVARIDDQFGINIHDLRSRYIYIPNLFSFASRHTVPKLKNHLNVVQQIVRLI